MSIQRLCPKAKVAKRDRTQEADFFRALADPYRLRIIATLARSDHAICVCDFTEAFPLKQPAVSHHLGVLRDAGIVKSERRGTWVYYSLADGLGRRVEVALDNILNRRIAA
jgi:ArsR family transcriptional regulator, arsenate/arsenite/antimonite-responsive transcriptional repressor